MFTIYCANCNQPVNVEVYPSDLQEKCLLCGYQNKLEPEENYFPKLVAIQGAESGEEFTIDGVTTLGRGSYNTIHLKERKASRKHALIKFQNDHFLIEDLRSGNGTHVNGKPVTSVVLHDKDSIRIAEAVFLFHNSYAYQPSESVSAPVHKAVLTEKRSNFARTRAELKFDAQHSFLMNIDDLTNVANLEKANKKLRILYEVNHAISSILDLQELLAVIVDVVFRYLPAERGAILLYDEKAKSLQSAVTKVRDQEQGEGPIKISRTILDRVIDEGVSLLTTDALVDERLAESMSIISQGIRSAMSVPLISKDNLLGVLHIDSTQKSSQFNSDTLELLTGIAGQAAIAIENATLIKKIEQEVETRGHLQRYLSPELVEQVVNKQIDLDIGGKLKKATILFTDLRGFTHMTEHIGAEAVVAVLNDYCARMVDIIFANSGTLDKFIGDAIMAIWGMPVSHIEDTMLAVRASLQMQEELFYFNIAQKKIGRNTLKMGVGINVGDVVVGNMGSPKRMEYTVIGPPVNLASRVEALTSRNQILISDNVYEEIKASARVVQLAPTHVKGIERAIQIFAVIGMYDPVEKHEINFLPILLKSEDGKVYEGLIHTFDLESMTLDVEPDFSVQKDQELSFSLDIPDVAPTDNIRGICNKTEISMHEHDQFTALDVTLTELPDAVRQFFAQVFPLQNFETTIYDDK